jgi:hypothetical protein
MSELYQCKHNKQPPQGVTQFTVVSTPGYTCPWCHIEKLEADQRQLAHECLPWVANAAIQASNNIGDASGLPLVEKLRAIHRRGDSSESRMRRRRRTAASSR